ncbi:GCN5 family acetyltransferase [Gilliamella sp. Occ4-3]|nr:GNAT family N-acetyltransferase [Gilliamella apicola]OCG75890.1 GCN5 family acetyltransferase [Gilliamella apicola]
MGKIEAPHLLNEHHDFTSFDCEELSLNEWLKKKSLKNQKSGAYRTFVICDNNKVIGFYCLSTGSIQHRQLTLSRFKRNMPDPIPVIILGRLAIDKNYKAKGLGAALLKDAILRSKEVSKQVGSRALLVHSLTDEANAFYIKFGFVDSGIQERTMLISLW